MDKIIRSTSWYGKASHEMNSILTIPHLLHRIRIVGINRRQQHQIEIYSNTPFPTIRRKWCKPPRVGECQMRFDGGKRPPPSLAAPRFEGAKAAPKNGVKPQKKQGRAQIWSRWVTADQEVDVFFVVEKHISTYLGVMKKWDPFWRKSNNCKIYDDFEGFPVFSSAGNITTPCIYSFKGTRPTSNFSLSQRSFDEKNRCTRCSVWSLQGWEEKEKEEEKTLGAQLLMEELEWIGCIL